LTVVDASAAISVILPDEDPSLRAKLKDALAASVLAPAHFRSEVTSAVLRASRPGRLTSAARIEAMAIAEEMIVKIKTSYAHPVAGVIYLAEQHGLSAYDASYLWLALDSAALLLTGDGRLYRVARKLGIAA
jgi:predicted nucleic acid-binding protein